MALPSGEMHVTPRSKLHARMVCLPASQLTMHHADSTCRISASLADMHLCYYKQTVSPGLSCISMRHASAHATSRHGCDLV